MTIEEMKDRKRELGYSYEQIAELSGLPLGTVQKVLGGITKSPRYDTLNALEKVFTEKPAMMIREAQPAYSTGEKIEKKQGEFTLEDYYSLPEERRVELIDGIIYDMTAPTNIHQLICGEIFMVFRDFIRSNKGSCIPAMAPLDVQLDCDNKTMVQPDVLVICDRNKLRYGHVYGAPDLIIEILSPSTRKKDSFLKTMKYSEAGVREYWIVDPKRKRVLAYYFEQDEFPVLYSFKDTIPVGIFQGECKVNFSEIYEYISFLYEQNN